MIQEKDFESFIFPERRCRLKGGWSGASSHLQLSQRSSQKLNTYLLWKITTDLVARRKSWKTRRRMEKNCQRPNFFKAFPIAFLFASVGKWSYFSSCQNVIGSCYHDYIAEKVFRDSCKRNEFKFCGAFARAEKDETLAGTEGEIPHMIYCFPSFHIASGLFCEWYSSSSSNFSGGSLGRGRS